MTRLASVRRVLWRTLLLNLIVAAAKVTTGLLTASLAMVADGIHSVLDGAANVAGLVGTTAAAQPPDEDHPYGHRRIETLTSLLIGGALLLTAWEIVQAGVNRLAQPIAANITTVNFVVMGVSVLVSLVVSRYERRAGLELNSELLLADSEHTRSDVWVSLTVIGSLVAARLGLNWVDPAAALVVVGIIGWTAWQVFRRSAAILIDRAPLDSDQVSRVVEEVAGVQSVERVRSRGPADSVHLDVDVAVAAPMTASHSAAVEREIAQQVRDRFEGIYEVQVRFVPHQSMGTNYTLMARAEADALGLGVHEVIAAREPDGVRLKMHVEVQPSLSVREAHRIVTDFENRLRGQSAEILDVITHIEPAPDSEQPAITSAAGLVTRALLAANAVYPCDGWHDVTVFMEADGGYAITMHCYVPGEMTMHTAHHMAEEVETQIRAAIPQVHRVTIHTEPPEAR
ncbi:MAG: cation-efflux pump [Chloroflexi bacterium]|nr:cation-efflux pump [Chloroflexota bacterium]